MGASASSSASIARTQHPVAVTAKTTKLINTDRVSTTEMVLVAVGVVGFAAGVAAAVAAIYRREKCWICLENVDSRKMIEMGYCHHRFCSSCAKNHVELGLRCKKLPQCPRSNCGLQLTTDTCRKFLSPQMYVLMFELAKESSIANKVYCPNPKCSQLMSMKFALGSNRTSNMELHACRCVKCSSLFCINCRVLWHSNMSCDAYKKLESNSRSSDSKLKELARKEKCRQCPKCYNMISRVQGCKRMHCRCGHRFCYTCGCDYSECSCKSYD